METTTPFQEKISGSVKLPSLAKNTHVLLKALTDDHLNYRQMAEIIKHYPEVSARLIYMTNSPWSAPVSPISSIEQACARLGTSIIKSLSIAISVSSSFDTRKCPHFDTDHFWTTAILASEGAGLLASLSPNANQDNFKETAETAGLLHNIGLLWLADSLPDETEKALQLANQDESHNLNSALQQLAGTDYCEVGGWIGEKMNLPTDLKLAIEYHLDENYQDSAWEISRLVGASAKIVSAIYHKHEPAPTNQGLQESLSIDFDAQSNVHHLLSAKFEKTCELASTLFS